MTKQTPFIQLLKLSLLAVLLATIFALAPAPAVHAAGFVVNNSGDGGDNSPGDGNCNNGSGVCTLRAAIEEANALAGNDTITFAGDYTIVLGSTLTLNSNVTINGTGHSVTISGNNAVRIFYVNNGSTVSISGLSLINGKAPNGAVGAVGANGGTGEMGGAGGVGGAGEQGGAIYNAGTLTVQTGTFIGSKAGNGGNGGKAGNGGNGSGSDTGKTGGWGGWGGAGGSGGAIYNASGGTLNLYNSTLYNNTAGKGGKGVIGGDGGGGGTGSQGGKGGWGGWGGEGGSGGAIYNASGGTLNLYNSTLYNNTVGEGGNGGDGGYGGWGGDNANGGWGGDGGDGAARGVGHAVANAGTMTFVQNTVDSSAIILYGGSGGFYGYGGDGGINGSVGPNGDFGRNYSGWKLEIITLQNSAGSAVISSSTVVNSNAHLGINNTSGTVSLVNTLVNGGCAGSITDNGNNLLQSGNTCGTIPTGNLALGELADNGGPTQTFALLPGSPAIDAGDNATCELTDQRGVARPIDGDGNGTAVCDIGAFEVSPYKIYLPMIIK